MMDAQEAARRHSFKKDVEQYFRLHPNEWLPASTFLTIGGRMAWRSRIAEARSIFEAEGGALENQQTRSEDGSVLSEYRYRPFKPLGRDGAERIPQKTLFALR